MSLFCLRFNNNWSGILLQNQTVRQHVLTSLDILEFGKVCEDVMY